MLVVSKKNMPASVKDSLKIFAFIYAISSIALSIIIHLFDFEIRGNMLNIFILVASAYFSAQKFTNKFDRLPDNIEKRFLIWGSFIAAYMVSIFLFCIFGCISFFLFNIDIIDFVIQYTDIGKLVKFYVPITLSSVNVLFFVTVFAFLDYLLLRVTYWSFFKNYQDTKDRK
jgi:hypothetical protein